MPDFTASTDTGEEGLIADMGQLAFYPREFVQYAYPWGQPGPLEAFDGPDTWQAEVLEAIGKQVRANNFDGVNPVKPIRFLISSGHGIGKTALIAWLADWIRSTRANSKGTVTANTLAQLRTKTWAEIRKWGRMSVTAPWFDFKAESLTHTRHPEWRCDLQTSAEENSEAFAGQHATTSTSYYLIDEGSGISDKIFEVAEGGLMRGEPMIFVFGNPTRNSGTFHEIHVGKKRKFWDVRRIDSREAKLTNKEKIAADIEENGLDSDFVRVRILGEPPKSDNLQFITEDMVTPALGRKLNPDQYYHAPIILGCDPAWQGEDYHVIVKRQGLMSWIICRVRHLPHETVGFTRLVAQAIDTHKVDATFVDMHGIGGGVIDQLQELGYSPIMVNSNSTTIEKPLQFRNARREMAQKMRDWLISGGSVPEDELTKQDLMGPYDYLIGKGPHAGKYMLESKPEMRSRGLDSPGFFDALAYTFYQPVTRRDHGVGDIEFDYHYGHGTLKDTEVARTKYNVFGYRKGKSRFS